jgi:hypothetical protein
MSKEEKKLEQEYERDKRNFGNISPDTKLLFLQNLHLKRFRLKEYINTYLPDAYKKNTYYMTHKGWDLVWKSMEQYEYAVFYKKSFIASSDESSRSSSKTAQSSSDMNVNEYHEIIEEFGNLNAIIEKVKVIEKEIKKKLKEENPDLKKTRIIKKARKTMKKLDDKFSDMSQKNSSHDDVQTVIDALNKMTLYIEGKSFSEIEKDLVLTSSEAENSLDLTSFSDSQSTTSTQLASNSETGWWASCFGCGGGGSSKSSSSQGYSI